MVSNAKSLMMPEELSNHTSYYQDFVIELPPNLLQQIMSSYQLKASDIIGNYVFNVQMFNQKMDAQFFDVENINLKQLLNTIHSWPQQLNWPQFNHQINNLLLAWLHDYKLGASLDGALLLVSCLTLQPAKTKELPHLAPDLLSDLISESIPSSKFQQLLMHLLARVTNQLDQYKFNHIQNFDLETGLPNQQLMLNFLNQHLQIDPEHTLLDSSNLISTNIAPVHLGLILVNLNINFDEASQLNAASSSLMMAAIHAIKRHLNDDATLFRVGPVELAIIIKHISFPAQLTLITSKIMHAFEAELPLENITLILKPYFGGVSSLKTRQNAIAMYDCAKLALHHAMINNYQIEFYDQHITASFSNAHQLDEAIIQALQQNELEIFFQPIVSLPNEVCRNAETLLRWQSEIWPSISPVRLVDAIYKKGFGKIFIRWLINNACQRVAELKSVHQRDISLTINLNGTDLLDEDLPELLAQSIVLWEIPAENLIIEITENDLLIDEEKAALGINKIVALGCKLALDDFGTGYSSMTRLRSMPIDLVKIDQSFVRSIATSIQDKAIVLSIVKLAHSLGKAVVAEGVEDSACLNILKQIGCNKIQGYYYAKPMDFSEFITWLDLFETQQFDLINQTDSNG